MIKLTGEQSTAVHDIGHSLVIACPGSGKTAVLIQKAIYLIDHCGVNSIHIVTFTRASANELQARINGYGEFYKSRVHCSTLHAICLAHLKKYCNRTSLVSSEEQHTYIVNSWNKHQKLVDEINKVRARNTVENGKFQSLEFKHLERYIDKRLNSSKQSGDVSLGSFEDCRSTFEKMYQSYVSFVDKEKFSSIQNVIQTTVDCMQNDPNFPLLPTEHLFLDECQDADPAQFRFLALHALNGVTTTIVGDDDQSLYSFRYALGVKIFKQFIAICRDKGVTQHNLTLNFRSKSEIVQACQNLISHNKERCDKNMLPHQGGGGNVMAVSFQNENQQLQEVVDMIKNDHHSSSIAILSRTNMELDSIEKLLSQEKIAYQRTDSKGYFDTSFCKQYLAALTACANRDLRRIIASLEPLMGSKQTAEAVANCIVQHSNPSGDAFKGKVKFSKKVIEALNFAYTNVADQALKSFTPLFLEVINQKGVPNHEATKIRQLCDILVKFKGPLKERLSVLQFEKEASQCRVSLMSGHGSKGCEFDAVYVINCDDDQFPKTRDDDEREYADIIEEERRLFFVAMSRAINELYLFTGKANNPSRFITEAGLDLKDCTYLG